ncbi:DUF4382 domain-containing protein [Oceanobacter mangrovi]|uniref:DUF4382 domain-containing protein n=1 Tax=Oceanobacter mangrovi TaxID=2862510 RepID=UPI001C8E6E3E|nr:DUF4382 domain-containing protein [Oceanobacter mangrovi]
MKTPALMILPLVSALLSACGGSSGSGGSDTAQLSMAMTDAAVNNATSLMLTVDSIELKSSDGTTRTITLNNEAKTFDLLALQGAQSVDLFTDQTVSAGDYQWMRLYIDEDASYLVTDDSAQHDISIPSNAQTGLKLNTPFTLPANQAATFVIDFDVAKSLTLANGEYKLRPTLRIVDQAEVGHIHGTVAAELLTDCAVPQVYAFEGSDSAFDDQGSNAAPVTSSLISYNEDNAAYEYELGYLLAGDYSLYMVCDADDPETDEDISAASDAQNVTVVLDQTVESDFEQAQLNL